MIGKILLKGVKMDLGQVAYDAYCNKTGGVSLVTGANLPGWDDLRPEIQDAWRAAAEAVMRLVQ